MKRFKSIVSSILLVFMILTIFTGCGNKQFIDTSYEFNYAYVVWPDGTSEKLAIESWNDFEDGDQLQIRTENGTYVFHSSNCVLASE